MRGTPVEDLSYSSFELRKYAKHLPRLVLDNDVLYRLFYSDAGQVRYKQFCVPQHLQKETVFRVHNATTAGHIGVTRTVAEFRQRFYFPGFSETLLQTIKNCLTCLQAKRVLQSQLTPPLQELSSLQSYPGDMLQIDLVGPLQSSAHTYVLSGIDVFTKYLFAVPLTSGHAKPVATALVNIFYNHSCIPDTIVSDLGTVFVASLIHASFVIRSKTEAQHA